MLIEHLYWTSNIKCVANCSFAGLGMLPGRYPPGDVWCGDVIALSGCWATPGTDAEWAKPMCNRDCYPTESEENNFVALRHVGPSPLGSKGSLYAEFHDAPLPAGADAVNWDARPASAELYDGRDDWQMVNLLRGGRGDSARVGFAAERLSAMLKAWVHCGGAQCP